MYGHLVLPACSWSSLIFEAQIVVRIICLTATAFLVFLLNNCCWVENLHGLRLSTRCHQILIISLPHVVSLILLVELGHHVVVDVGLICKATCRCEFSRRCRINCVRDKVLNFGLKWNVNWCHPYSLILLCVLLVKLLSSRQSHEFDVPFLSWIVIGVVFLSHVLTVEDLLVVFAHILLNAGLISILISIRHVFVLRRTL